MATITKDLSCNIPLLKGSGADFHNWSYRVRLFLEAKDVADVQTLFRKLKTAGATLAEIDLVSQLFLTLSDSFDPLVAALENVAEEDLNFNLVQQRLLAEERKQSDRQGDSVAYRRSSRLSV